MSLSDARTDVGATLDASICIVGAGAAGITLARALAETQDDILLIDSGGLDYSDETQALCRGENVGLPYHDLDACRLRYFGGTTNHWGGYCRSNDPINYEARPDLGIEAWPVSFEEMRRHVSAAAKMLGIGDNFFEPAALLADLNGKAIADEVAGEPDVFLAVNQIAEDIRFAERFGDAIIASPRIHLVTNLNAVEVVPSADRGRIAALECATLTGKSVTVRARRFVLACHSIENARLLLASTSREPAGVGNGHDLVGRHFMEHPYVHASLVIASEALPPPLRRRHSTSRGRLVGLSLAPETMRARGALAYTCYFSNRVSTTALHSALRGVASGWTQPWSDQFLADVRTVLSDPEFAADAIGRRIGLSDGPPYLVLEQMIEQAPDPASRVRLSPTGRDPFGRPRAELDWRLHELDYHTFRVGQDAAVRALGALGYGRVRVEEIDADLVADRVIGHYHHYGTTRMGASPSRGVVDRDLRVFGKPNLYVCGASVFPTSGAHGPTLHIIATALRLAEHLSREIARG